MTKVRIPTQLRSYTGAAEVDAEGATVGEILADLDRRYPGLRFRVVDEQGRIRTHMRVFVGMDAAASLDETVVEGTLVQIMGALSGG